jgi:acyl dehydratase
MTDDLLHAEDLHPGEVVPLGSVEVTAAEIIAFATTYDPLPIHVDPVAAAAGPFGGVIASAAHTIALYSSLASRVFVPRLALVAGKGIDRLRLPHPVRPGALSATIEVIDVTPTRPDRADLRLRSEMTDQDGHVVLSFVAVQVVRRRDA